MHLHSYIYISQADSNSDYSGINMKMEDSTTQLRLVLSTYG
jgi:hypothetical protein